MSSIIGRKEPSKWHDHASVWDDVALIGYRVKQESEKLYDASSSWRDRRRASISEGSAKEPSSLHPLPPPPPPPRKCFDRESQKGFEHEK